VDVEYLPLKNWARREHDYYLAKFLREVNIMVFFPDGASV
jgi:hypothetical protein